MTRTYKVTSRTGELIAVVPVGRIADVRLLVAANPGASIKAYASIDDPCVGHPAFEADNCPGCGTAALIAAV